MVRIMSSLGSENGQAPKSDFWGYIEPIIGDTSHKKRLDKIRNYITNRVPLEEVSSNFESWLNPANGVKSDGNNREQ
ncbi:hypothetical protein [Mucilaginibacter sp.]|uniref:hypothetical protein n=1 Tax=Mucilaginibacter sp. TaxID=1882438 RepID=UPI003263B569